MAKKNKKHLVKKVKEFHKIAIALNTRMMALEELFCIQSLKEKESSEPDGNSKFSPRCHLRII